MPTIDIHLGWLRADDRPVLERVFVAPARVRLAASGVEVRVIDRSETPDLIRSLADPRVIGVLWLGHPALDLDVKSEKIVHSYLQTASGRYIPKSLFTAAHPQLRFVSLVTCHSSAVSSNYWSSISPSVRIYESPSTQVGPGNNPILEFTSLYLTPRVLDAVAADLPAHLAAFEIHEPVAGFHELEIAYRDLLSSRFDYEVLLNGRLIGVLQPGVSASGRKVPRARTSFSIASQVEGPLTLQISPDDPTRPHPAHLPQVIDDILLDQVRWEGRELLASPVHLGDDESAWDQAIGLSAVSHASSFEQAGAPVLLWQRELP